MELLAIIAITLVCCLGSWLGRLIAHLIIVTAADTAAILRRVTTETPEARHRRPVSRRPLVEMRPAGHVTHALQAH